jgi:hypothetical protein
MEFIRFIRYANLSLRMHVDYDFLGKPECKLVPRRTLIISPPLTSSAL